MYKVQLRFEAGWVDIHRSLSLAANKITAVEQSIIHKCSARVVDATGNIVYETEAPASQLDH